MNEPNSLEVQKGETAEKFRERIDETQRELKRQEKAAETAAKAALVSAQVAVPASDGDVPPAASQTTEKSVLKTGNAELDEWLAKKGPMTVENLAKHYRESEREMYRQMDEARKAKAEPVTPVPQVPPATFPPYYQIPPPIPSYVPATPIHPPMNTEALAKQYGLSPEDFEKVAPLANDMARSVVDQTLSRVLPPLYQQVQGVGREVGRQKELVDLMSDPAFKNPQVQFEMDRVFKEEPNAFVAQAQPIRYAYEKALTRIAREQLGGSNAKPFSNPAVEVPANSKPPATAGGNGSGGGGVPQGGSQEMTPELFAGLSMAEKMAHLVAIGVRPK